MALLRMDNVGIVVEDLAATVAFFRELGLNLEGEMRVDGDWAARCVGLPGQVLDVAMMRTPDGHSRLELMCFVTPAPIAVAPKSAPANALGIRRLMFAVDDIDDTIARLAKHGATLVGELVTYEDMYKLCYLRGPEGMIVALAQQLR